MHRFSRTLLVPLVLVFSLVATAPARAATLLRDADIEYGLTELAKPVLRAAGLSPTQVRILVIDDPSLNAFVVDSQHIFLNSGLLMKLKSAREVQAVIAHEAAHITNGHLTRRAANMGSVRTAAGLGLVLAAAAAAAGGGQAATGIAIGTTGAALRNFLAHTRSEESSADQSSIRYLVRAGIDPQGAVDVQEIFRGQEALSASRQDPYMRSHPLTRDRIRALKGMVTGVGKSFEEDRTARYWFARVQGKLSAFKRAPAWTLRRADKSLTPDIALMRKAAAHHRRSDLKKALSAIDQAIAMRPNDPLLLDLKGQILLENRRANDAAAVWRRAVEMAPGQALILGGYGRALLAANQPKAALNPLERARAADFRDARILRDLSVAYAKTGQPGMASLVTAERYALQGRLKDAGIHGKRAADLLPRGSGPWRRAQDVLGTVERAARR